MQLACGTEAPETKLLLDNVRSLAATPFTRVEGCYWPAVVFYSTFFCVKYTPCTRVEFAYTTIRLDYDVLLL
jgi:hypothetical protein